MGSPQDNARARAFAGLVDRHALDEAYRYATLILGDRAEAEDATHDAVLSAWQRFGDLREPARFDAWFGRILVNACRDRLRRRRRLTSLELPRPRDASGPGSRIDAGIALAESDMGSTDPADGVARRTALAEALRSLSAEHREVIVLRFYVDLTVDQIAARTGVGSGTVKSRLHYGLSRLRAVVGEPGEEGEP